MKIKCVTCKCEFNLESLTIRNCDKCRVIKKNEWREKWNKKRRQARGVKNEV